MFRNMDTFRFHDVRAEKANASSRYRTTQKITVLFRFVELFVFLIVVSRFSTTFTFSFRPSGEFLKGISVTLISPRFVFVVGNVIVLVLLLKSGEFSAKKGRKSMDFYDEYVEKCRKSQETCCKEKKKSSVAHKYNSVCSSEGKLSRSRSENIEKSVGYTEERRVELRRNMTERWRGSVDSRLNMTAAAAAAACSSNREDGMSGEEFRGMVEAFIARQQRSLREEE